MTTQFDIKVVARYITSAGVADARSAFAKRKYFLIP